MNQRILILTAAFGEGHNSAARNVAAAFRERGWQADVADPCLAGAPILTKILQRLYRFVTTYMPQTWARIYRSTDQHDFSRETPYALRGVERKIEEILTKTDYVGVVCTYPLYPYFLQRIFAQRVPRCPVFTVVTDSMEINQAWLNAPSQQWFVTDSGTREQVVAAGLADAAVTAAGFPVSLQFSDYAAWEDAGDFPEQGEFRVVYFPTPNGRELSRMARAILLASPEVKLTLVLGKNVRLLSRKAREIRAEFAGRVKIIGWTRRVPHLMKTHQLIVGKAGGATVHEAIAAACPMLIHLLVPGQEEGNLRLLQQIGSGNLADTPEAVSRQIREMLANDGAGWKAMKRAVEAHGVRRGAQQTVEWIEQFYL